MRGIFRFPIEQCTDQLLPSRVHAKINVVGLQTCIGEAKKNAHFEENGDKFSIIALRRKHQLTPETTRDIHRRCWQRN